MTRLEIYRRLRDIVDSSNVDDALELTTYCDKTIAQIERSMKPVEARRKELAERDKIDEKYVLEILSDEQFMPYDIIIGKLRKQFPQRIWDIHRLRLLFGKMAKENKVEKIRYVEYMEEGTNEIKKGTGYRKI